MSLSPVLVLDPRIDVREDLEKNHIIHKGAQRSTNYVQSSDSYQLNVAPTQSSWSISPPSNQTIVDRFIRVRHYVEFDSTNANIDLGINSGFRQFPISSITDVATLSINGEQVSENIQSKLHAMLTYGNTPEQRRKSWSVAPCQPDSYQDYGDYLSYGSARNPLADYGENSTEPSRGGFEVEVTVVNKTVRAVITEPIWVSPLYNGMGAQVEGLVNVNQLNLTLRYNTNSSRVFCHHDTGAIPLGASTGKFYQAPELLVTYLTPDMTQPIPSLQVLPYQSCNEYVRELSSIPAGNTSTVFSDTIRLSQIPRFVYLFARRNEATSTYETSDSFLGIENVSVQWNNEAGLLSGATKQDLFEMSSRNGCNLSYPAWTKYRGSVLALEMGKDIGLPDGMSPGVNGQFTIQCQVTFKNLDASAYVGTFYLVTVNEGVFTVAANVARSSLGGVSPDKVMQASESMEKEDHTDLEGGSFWSSAKSIVKKGHKAIRKHSGLAKKLAETAGIVVAPEAALAYEAAKASGVLGGSSVGGKLVGGQGRRRMRR
jgi:hypothetical protein